MPHRLLPVLVIAVAFTVLAAACGDSGESPAGQSDPPVVTTVAPVAAVQPEAATPAAPTAAVTSDLPDVTVVDLAGGEVQLTSLAPSDRPILLWFWAPH